MKLKLLASHRFEFGNYGKNPKSMWTITIFPCTMVISQVDLIFHRHLFVVAINGYLWPVCCSRMHSEGFLLYFEGLGLETCSLDAVCRPQRFATVRTLSQPSAAVCSEGAMPCFNKRCQSGLVLEVCNVGLRVFLRTALSGLRQVATTCKYKLHGRCAEQHLVKIRCVWTLSLHGRRDIWRHSKSPLKT